MEQQIVNNSQAAINPAILIEKYQKALIRTGDRVGSSYTASLAKAPSPVHNFLGTLLGHNNMYQTGQAYVTIQENLLQAVKAFIDSLQTILDEGVKNNATWQAINISLMAKQYEFAGQLSDYLGQPMIFSQPTTLTHFLKILREQIQFQTDIKGEKIKQNLATSQRDYVKDYIFPSAYPNLVAANDEENKLYGAFMTDCETLMISAQTVEMTKLTISSSII